MCNSIQHVPEVAKEIHNSREFKQITSTMSRIQDQLKKLQQKKQLNKKQLQQKAKLIITSVKNLRSKLNKMMNILEKNTTQMIDSMISDIEKTIDSEVKTCHLLTNQMKKTSNTMNTTGVNNEVVAFRGMKKGQEHSKEAKRFLESIRSEDVTLTFKPNLEIERFLSSLESLGEVVSYAAVETDTHTTSSLQPLPVIAISPTVIVDTVYKVDKVRKYNLMTTTKTHMNVCCVTGICFLADGKAVVSEFCNNKLRLLNDKYRVIDQYDVPPLPQDVCHITGSEVAVTVSDGSRQEIHIIDAVQGNMICTRTLKLNQSCRGITYHSGQLYVGGEHGLFVYSLTGTLVKKLYKDDVKHVAVSDDGHRIYLSTGTDNSLVTLDSTGEKLSTLNDLGLRDTTGVAVGRNGTVFVSGNLSNIVIQTNREGNRKLATIATATDGVYLPWSLCLNRKTNELLIGQCSAGVSLLVSKLK